MKRTFSLAILVLCLGRGQSQKNFSVTLHFPSQLQREKITVWYDDGKDSYRKNPDSTNTMYICGPFYARWVIVGIFYPDSSRPNYYFGNNFCATDQPAEITIRMDGHPQDPLQDVQLKNAWLLNDMGKGRFDAFVHDELKAYDDCIRKSTPRTDSTDSVARVLGTRLVDKELEYIRRNPGDYYCIHVFRDWLCRASYMKADTALQFFNTVFPDSLKQSFEGQEALKRIRARLGMKEGNKAPDYSAKDIYGKAVSPADDKGKYVLLDFWASWCVPCVESLPMLKQLQKDYGPDKLKVISITLDTHRNDFDRTLKEHGMDWTQIYGNTDLIKAYNIGPIPQVVLIGPDGNIAYIRHYTDEHGKLTGDGDYVRLKAILKEGIR